VLLSPHTWKESAGRLEDLGFRRQRADAYAADDVTLTVRHGWLTLSAPDPAPAGPGDTALIGRPGLWKTAVDGRGQQGLTFDVPLMPLLERLDEGSDDEVAPAAAVAALVRWALETRSGSVVAGWQPPPSDWIEARVDERALTLRCGPRLRRVSVVAEKQRLALRVQICQAGAEIEDARRQWLERLLDDAATLRLVRIGLRDSGAGCATAAAEIDLSAAPASVLEAALPIALDALSAAFAQLADTAALICDPECRGRMLDQSPNDVLLTLDSRFTKTRSKTP
jgi:hypothetical protein